MYRLNDKAVLFAPPETIEPEALKQIENTASMGFVFKHVAVMPDCHFGKGATVGTVLATKGAIIPAAVGVDIGCGMVAVRTPLGRGDIRDPAQIRTGIERRIPMSAGQQQDAERQRRAPRQGARIARRERLQRRSIAPGSCRSARSAEATISSSWPPTRRRGVGDAAFRIARHRQQDWQPAYQARADDRAEQGTPLPDRDLAYLVEDTTEFDDYVADLRWAQEFARLNRDEMMDRVMIEVSRSDLRRPPIRWRSSKCSASTAITISARSKSISARRSG